MITRKSLSWLLCMTMVFSSVVLSSCSNNKTKFTAYSLDYFDTATTITGYEFNKESFDEISGQILEDLEEYHRLFTIYQRFEGTDNLCTINETTDGAHSIVEVDEKIINMLLYAQQMHAKTNGKVNIAMGSVLSIWHDYRKAGMDDPTHAELPPMDSLAEAAGHTDIDDLIIDEENGTVYIADPEMKLDVGAIAKGYAVEMIARDLEEKGISGYVINVGGNVRTIGTKPDGSNWIVGIENPDDDEESAYVAYLELAGETLVTSGSYQRYYTVDGKNYHHIIDPSTLLPAERYLSVSVVCDNSAQADALSTALFCMSLDEGLELVNSLDKVEALWVMADGTQRQSVGFSSYATEYDK